MVRIGSVIACCLLLAAAPARAQNSDIFREDAPPAPAPAPAPKPAPRPHVYSQPEPEIVAPALPPAPAQPVVAPTPNLPSAAQLWTRVRQVANGEGIAVPLSGTPPFDLAGTPPQFRLLLGAWGPGVWQGTSGEKTILVIQSVDSDGAVRGFVGKSAGASLPAAWGMATGVAAGGRIALQAVFFGAATNFGSKAPSAEVSWTFQLRPDGTLAGSRDNGASTIALRRLQ
jgi:hypothetical protein